MLSYRSSRRAAAALAVALVACSPTEPATPPSEIPSEPKANADANSSYVIAQENARASLFDWSTTPDFMKMQVARAVADLDGDGVVDAVVAPGLGLEQVATVPMRFYKGSAAGGTVTLTDNTPAWANGTLPNVNHGRKLILGDFNGDGVKDVFVCAHGYDAPPFPGTRNFLLLSEGGKWAVALGQPWTLYAGFHHGCAAGDLNNDGDLDILVLDSKTASYVLINDGTGKFMQGRAGIPADLNRPTAVFSVEVLDIDKDGYNDFIVGGGETHQPTVIYWGLGNGYFSDGRATMLPAVSGWQNPLSFAVADIDGDGTTEIVISRTKGEAGTPDFYKGFYVQVLRLNGRATTDVTTSIAATLNASAAAVVKDQGGAPTWIEWVWLADYDGDGKKDLIGSSSQFGSGKFWAKNSGSSFEGWIKLP